MSPILEAALELQAYCQVRELEPLLELKGAPEAATRLGEILRLAR